MKVLLSINPVHAEKIFSGTKKYEYRKNVFKRDNVRTVVVYVTKPVARIVGEFDVNEIVDGSPQSVWEKTREYSGISEEFFLDYYNGRERAVALAIGEVRTYPEAIDPQEAVRNFTPPQSFLYLDEEFNTAVEQQLALFPI
jgi:predicted transcriptional regulator